MEILSVLCVQHSFRSRPVVSHTHTHLLTYLVHYLSKELCKTERGVGWGLGVEKQKYVNAHRLKQFLPHKHTFLFIQYNTQETELRENVKGNHRKQELLIYQIFVQKRNNNAVTPSSRD